MSCTIKAISMAANASLIPVPSLFAKAKASYSHSILTIPLKPVKLQLTLPTIRNKIPNLKFSVVASVQEENNPVLVEEEEGEGFQGDFNWDGQESSEEEFEGGEESDGDTVASGDAEDYVEPSEEAKLYVGNLPFDVDSEKLAQLFEQAGVVEICEVVYNRVTDQSRGFAFVTMSTVEEAEKAVETFNGYDLNGRRLVVNKAAPRGSRPERRPRTFEASNRIYVGNLPWNVRDAELEEIFSEHGKVVSARVVADRDTGRSRGFGFVVMSRESEMNDAIANLDGQSVEGRVIRVSVAESRT